MKSGFTAVDTNCAATQLFFGCGVWEKAGLWFCLEVGFLLPHKEAEQVTVTKNVSNLKIIPANTSLVSLLDQ